MLRLYRRLNVSDNRQTPQPILSAGLDQVFECPSLVVR
jgi:hypothetical protein